MAVEGTALRKRQQIAKANRMMFLWIAGVSVVVGVAAVASVFLVQKALFNEKVLAEKSRTASTLVQNNKVIGELQNQVRILNTNDDLKGAMVPGEAQPVQVVLDALPSEVNSSAFGASLQQKFLTADGIQLDSLNVKPVQDVEVSKFGKTRSSNSRSTSKATAEYRIEFDFNVSTSADNANGLKDLLVRLERSIRPIDLTDVVVEAQGNRLVLQVEGYTYYEPAVTGDLKDKTVKP
jgi:hypothetical protein